MSMSKSIVEEKKNKRFYYHGEDIRSKKFQKRMSKKLTLTRAILINTAIIVVSIVIVWLFIILNG